MTTPDPLRPSTGGGTSPHPLYQPLGTAPDRAPRRFGAASRTALVLCALAAIGVGAAVALRPARTPVSGGDVAVARIQPAPPPPALPPAPPPAAAPPGPPPSGDPTVGAEGSVEIQHGVKVIRLGAAATPSSLRLPAAGGAAVPLAPAPDPRLVEMSADGALPRIGPDGARPADVYARPAPAGVAGTPRLALLLGGLGRDQMLTAEAVRQLPPDVTLAFPPDGQDLPTQVREARAAGHEAVLQLRADASGPDGLRRRLARFAGYAGVLLDPALAGDAGVAGEVTRRGLYLVGAAPAAPAGGQAADLVVQGDPAAQAAALDRLAAMARARGTVLGIVPEAGANLEAVTAFARGLKGRGIDLVPVSVVAGKGREASATR